MPKKRKKDRKKPSSRQLRDAARRREQHVRIVNERQGDPRYVQQTWHDDGSRTIQMNDSTAEAVRQQRERFIEKFGREPEPDDPLFFDPTADEPRPMGEPDWDEIFAAFDAAGIERAYGEAWRELGYLVTEDNRHTFTAHEVEAFAEVVEQYLGES